MQKQKLYHAIKDAIKIIIILLCITPIYANAARVKNARGQEHFTVESPHFRIHYHRGLDHIVPRVAEKLEELYHIYAETYAITLPQKTEVVLYESEIPNAFAYPNFNFLYLGIHDYEFNLRGSGDWFDDVIAHEYAHVVSIQTGLKLPPAVPAIQLGYFGNRNSRARFEGMHVIPSETMPIWFLEGIAQYESTWHGADRWDAHRDMIMRTRTLSNTLLSWPHMQVFAGRGDEYEMAYNHGLSLIIYISETYGFSKVVSILRENARITRLSFDGSVKAVLGISATQLYNDWQAWLRGIYEEQIRAIGTQVFGRKISRAGYDNLYPTFSRDEDKIYFVSNDYNEYSLRNLFSYNMSDTVSEDHKIKFELPISSNFDIHYESGRVAYVSMKSSRSNQPPHLGGQRLFDVFMDDLPSDNRRRIFRRRTERQVTEARSAFAAAFSPSGDELAIALRKFDRFYLAIVDTSGENIRIVYPHVQDVDAFFNTPALPSGTQHSSFCTIFGLAWSPNGRDIAVDYIDGGRRNIGVFDTTQKTFSVMRESDHIDRRQPSFNRDGSAIYFSSDDGGIFNIYRYVFESGVTEKLTNVSGGAFHPSASREENMLVYSGYDKDGYGIYLIDSLAVLETFAPNTLIEFAPRTKNDPQDYTVGLSNRQQYSRFPRQLLVVPTVIAEVRDMGSGGYSHSVLGGAIINFLDPLAWANIGNEGGAYLLVDLARIFDFIDLDAGLISPRASYEAGAFLTSQMLPVTINAEFAVRGISAIDNFYDESEGRNFEETYRVQLTNALLEVIPFPHWRSLNFSAFGGFDRYDVVIDFNDTLVTGGTFDYVMSQGFRAGINTSFMARESNPRSNISPLGMAGKLQYTLWHQQSIREENSFEIVGGSILKEQFDEFLFHQIDGRLLMGMRSPIYSKHDLHFDIDGSYIVPIRGDDLPSFFYPVAHVPGYTYYFESERPHPNRDTAQLHDTVLVTGLAVISAEASYRFPIWPGRIDKKLGFLYFDMLYGALNVNAGAGFDTPSDLWNWNRSDWLLSYGAEARLEALTFNNYPLSLSFRWDYGANENIMVNERERALGGHRFAFTLGFNFDNWESVRYVDYFTPARMRNRAAFRAR